MSLLKSLKFIALIGIIVSSISNTKGNSPWDPRIYCGLALGGSHLSAKNTLSVDNNNFNTKLSGSSTHGEMLVGYGVSNGAIYVGLEGHVGLSKLETQALLDIAGTNTKHPLNIKSSPTGGLAVHIGYFINPASKAYIKLGVEVKKFSTKFRGYTRFIDHSKNYYSLGFMPGLGIETEITPTITIRTEYRIGIHAAKQFTSSKNTQVIYLRNKPTTHTATIGALWRL